MRFPVNYGTMIIRIHSSSLSGPSALVPRHLLGRLPVLGVTVIFLFLLGISQSEWAVHAQVPNSAALLIQYEPILKFHGGGHFVPMDVESFIMNSSLWDQSKLPDEQIRFERTMSLSDLSGTFSHPSGVVFSSNTYLKFVENNTFGWVNKAHDEYQNITTKQRTYYGRAAVIGQHLVLQYWFFYAFNDFAEHGGINNHEGDREMISIFIDQSTNKPVVAAYSRHFSSGSDVSRRWVDVEKVEDHPVVYVAAGAHANFFHCAENTGFGDAHLGNGRQVGP